MSLAGDDYCTGGVFKKSLGQYWVEAGGEVVVCELSNRLRKQLVYPTAAPSSRRQRVVAVAEIAVVDPVAVGDEVRFARGDGEHGLIVEVLPRRSKLARLAAGGGRPIEQVIVANLDQVVPILPAWPAPKWRLLDRYLVAAESLDLPSLVVVTKWDRVEGRAAAELMAGVEIYRRAGYDVVVTSAETGLGVAEFAGRLRDRVSVLIGSSGVGKTSLLNAVQPGLDLRVREISQATGKGKHTTTHVELFRLAMGGAVVDVPGMREFGLWQVGADDLAQYFPELRPHLGRCRYGLDCGHDREPGCAVKAAVDAGEVSTARYESYRRLRA